jgi:hypothetical protein
VGVGVGKGVAVGSDAVKVARLELQPLNKKTTPILLRNTRRGIFVLPFIT